MRSEEIIALEQELAFDELDNAKLMKAGMHVINSTPKPVRVRIVFNGDIVFQHIMDGKSGDMWLNRKQNTLEHFGHSGYYLFLKNEETHEFDQYRNDERYAICGGSFPLYVKGELVGGFYVSGLAHDEDHELIIKALKYIKEER